MSDSAAKDNNKGSSSSKTSSSPAAMIDTPSKPASVGYKVGSLMLILASLVYLATNPEIADQFTAGLRSRLGISGSFPENWKPHAHGPKPKMFASQSETITDVRFHQVNCSNGYQREVGWRSAPGRCGLLVTDLLLTTDQAQRLKKLVTRLVDEIGYNNAEYEESLNIRRVKMYEVFNEGMEKGLFTEDDYELVYNASASAMRIIAAVFGLPEYKLFFTSVTEMTRFKPVTEWREFRHVDKVRSPPLLVTSIFWMSDKDIEFGGGGTEYLIGGPEPYTPLIVEPKVGRFAAWTSAYEMPHGVTELTWGERYALLFAITAHGGIGHKTLDHLREWSYNMTGGEEEEFEEDMEDDSGNGPRNVNDTADGEWPGEKPEPKKQVLTGSKSKGGGY